MIKQKGLSLIELIIALAVGLFLLAGLLSVFTSMKATTEKVTRYGELQENGRLAMSLLMNDLMHQAFWGDLVASLSYSTMESIPDVLTDDCIGSGENNRTFPQEEGYFRTLWGETLSSKITLNCIKNGKVGSDVIQIKRALAHSRQDIHSVKNLSKDRFYLISNRNSGAIFDGDSTIPSIENGNIWQYQHHIYYVREDTIAGEKVPILMFGRLDSDNKPFHFSPVIDGIEYLHFTYGVDIDGDGVVNMFLSANDMLNSYWDHEAGSQILAITVYVLVRELQPDHQYENTNTYQLGNVSLNFIDKSGRGDNYHRLLLTSTVTLSNAGVDIW